MRSTTVYSIGHGTDCGRVREQNEDIYIADPKLGVFCVIDGMGGHAGGQVAAKIASEQILRRMRNRDKDPETRVREAIALASRAIYRERERSPEISEMACVLTLASIEGNQVTVGHVGDTRLYKIRGQRLTLVTTDHSPVGAMVREHRLTELQAMKHPDRNLVTRDVGSADRQPFAPHFIDTYSFDLEPDSAFLLCSDGLCDQVTPERMLSTVREHASDPQAGVDTLLRLANEAGGKDNATAILVCGRDFAMSESAKDHDKTQRLTFGRGWLIAPIVAVAAALALWKQPWRQAAIQPPAIYVDPEISDDATHFRSLSRAIEAAPAGAVIRVLSGRHRGPIALRSGIQLHAAPNRDVALFVEGSAPAVVVANQLPEATLVEGFRIVATRANAGVESNGSWVILKNNTISGAAEAGVRARGGSTLEMSGNRIESGSGAMGLLATSSAVDVRRNHFLLPAGMPAPKAVEIRDTAGEYRVTVEQNELINCAGECVTGVRDWRRHNIIQKGSP